MRYTVTAERGRDPRTWVLQCQEVPGAISQTRRLADAPALMREAIAFAADVEEQQIEIDVVPTLPRDLMVEVRQAKGAIQQLASAQTATARLSRKAAADLRGAGLTGADIGTVLGVSPQRVSQLLAGKTSVGAEVRLGQRITSTTSQESSSTRSAKHTGSHSQGNARTRIWAARDRNATAHAAGTAAETSETGVAFDRDGAKIGSIAQVYLDDSSGEAAWVTVDTGPVGTPESFIPLRGAQVDGKDVHFSYTRDEVHDAPRVDDTEQHLDAEQEQQLYRYYGVSSSTTDNDQRNAANDTRSRHDADRSRSRSFL